MMAVATDAGRKLLALCRFAFGRRWPADRLIVVFREVESFNLPSSTRAIGASVWSACLTERTENHRSVPGLFEPARAVCQVRGSRAAVAIEYRTSIMPHRTANLVAACASAQDATR
jgi:hypothetical protein